jgi:hypothetical protein
MPPSDDEADGAPAGDSRGSRQAAAASAAFEIFPASAPPSRRRAPPAPSGGGKKRKNAQTAQINTSAAAPAAAATIPTRDTSQPTDLLDDRDVADPDEQYTDNERALTHFLRLHPMLS